MTTTEDKTAARVRGSLGQCSHHLDNRHVLVLRGPTRRGRLRLGFSDLPRRQELDADSNWQFGELSYVDLPVAGRVDRRQHRRSMATT